MELLSQIGWPVLDRIRIGPLAISPHGIGIAAGYLVGAMLMVRLGRKRGISEDHAGTILLAALIGAIFGARFFYVVGHFSEFDGFFDMLAIWRGGISLVGGIFGAIIFAYPFMRRYGYRFLQVMDAAAPGLALGIIIGRIGDLVIGDHLGKPTDFFLGFEYRGGNLPGYLCVAQDTPAPECITVLPDGTQQFIGIGDVVHQTALYDFFIAIGLFALLWWMNRRPRREGVLIMTFAIIYGAGRILTDFLRVDKEWFGLTGSQWAAVAVILISIAALVRFAVAPLPEGATEPEPDEIEGGDEAPSTRFTPPPEPGGPQP